MDYIFDRGKRKVTIKFPNGEVNYWGMVDGMVVQYPTEVRADVKEALRNFGLGQGEDLKSSEIEGYLQKLK